MGKKPRNRLRNKAPKEGLEPRRYRNPPIQEAVCEVRFAPGPETDFASPARFYEAIRASYPGKPRHHQVVATAFQMATDQTTPKMSMQQQGVALVLFPSGDGFRLVGLGQNLLTVHDLRPYSGWDQFRPRIERALSAYQAADKPAGIKQIALRYINRMVLPGSNVDLLDYVTVVPQLPPTVPVAFSGYFSRLEAVYEDKPIRLILMVASVPPTTPNEVALMLDIEVRYEWTDQPQPLNAALTHIDELRERERIAFEAFITDKARGVFDG